MSNDYVQQFDDFSKQIILQKYETESTQYLKPIQEQIIKLLKEGITRADTVIFINTFLSKVRHINHEVTANDFDKFLKQINYKKSTKRKSPRKAQKTEGQK